MRKKGGKRKPVQPSENGHIKGANLTHMREVAYGMKTVVDIHKTLKHSEEMRNDSKLLADASDKRLRRQERNKKLMGKSNG